MEGNTDEKISDGFDQGFFIFPWFDGSMLAEYQFCNVLMDNYFHVNIMMDSDSGKFLDSSLDHRRRPKI